MDLPDQSSHMGSSFTWFNLILKSDKVSVMGRISDTAKKFPMATCALCIILIFFNTFMSILSNFLLKKNILEIKYQVKN
jgi:hypothetical protein